MTPMDMELALLDSAEYLYLRELSGHSDDEIFTGKLFRVYTQSHFLDHLARDTGGHTETILLFKWTCLNHRIDVAAYSPPEVRLVGAVSAQRARIQ
jgi:hypothetical protein